MATSSTRTCLVCEAAEAREVMITKTFARLGRSATYQRRQWQCEACDEATTTDEQAAFNGRELARAQAAVLGTITAADLRRLREQLSLTQIDMESLFGLGKKTIARWESGQRELPPYIAALVRLAVLHPASVRELQAIAAAPQLQATKSTGRTGVATGKRPPGKKTSTAKRRTAAPAAAE